MSKEKEILDQKWSSYRNVDIDKNLFEEALGVLDSIHDRSTDVVNWEERNEIAALAQKASSVTKGFSSDDATGSFYGEDQQQNASAKASSPKEKALMDNLAGIINHLEESENGSKG